MGSKTLLLGTLFVATLGGEGFFLVEATVGLAGCFFVETTGAFFGLALATTGAGLGLGETMGTGLALGAVALGADAGRFCAPGPG